VRLSSTCSRPLQPSLPAARTAQSWTHNRGGFLVNIPPIVGQIILWVVIAILAVFLFQNIVLPLIDKIA